MTEPEAVDFLVVGAGMAGASAAYFLAAEARVALIERESQPGYHTTGRSAAMFSEIYGNAQIRGLSRGGRRFFVGPPAGFAEAPLLTPRGALFFGRADQMAALDALLAEIAEPARLRPIDGARCREYVPVLRPDYVAGGAFEADAMDIDVAALHQGFLRGLKARGGSVVTDAELLGLAAEPGVWRAETRAGAFRAQVVINAAGAWCDAVAELAGVRPVGLTPKRRTAIVFQPGTDCTAWPLAVDCQEEFYFKPEAGRLLGSPADETPMPPCDVQPEELDIAICADRIQTATTLTISRIERSWAGLRSFVADKTPVAGFDADRPGFFWLAGQGGYGIQTAPGLGRTAAALAQGRPVPGELQDLGVSAAELSPRRLR